MERQTATLRLAGDIRRAVTRQGNLFGVALLLSVRTDKLSNAPD